MPDGLGAALDSFAAHILTTANLSAKGLPFAETRPRTMNEISKVGVVVPAHNEASVISECLACIQKSALHVPSIEVEIFVVCDACDDATPALVAEAGLTPILVDVRNVGEARAVGASAALMAGAHWLAFTDADTCVSPTWLADQLALGSDAFCGTVAVSDWGVFGEAMRKHFHANYTDADGHRHIHGANLGISANAYRAVGGFQPLASSEDVAIVEALRAADFNIAWSAAPRVTTSARHDYRAPGGFGATLERIASAFHGRRDRAFAMVVDGGA